MSLPLPSCDAFVALAALPALVAYVADPTAVTGR